jgi:Uma2 family endonuclease
MDQALVTVPGSPAIGPYTWADFVALADDDRRELIDGHLIEVEVPTQLHEYIVAMLIARLVAWADANDGGTVLASGYKVRITNKRGVMPDVQYYKPGHLPPGEQQGLVTGQLDLAIEVLSESSRNIDRVAKMTWYAARRVPEYWIVDPGARTLERYLLRKGRYLLEPHGSNETFAPDTFPGLTLSLSRLWTGPRPARKRRTGTRRSG